MLRSQLLDGDLSKSRIQRLRMSFRRCTLGSATSLAPPLLLLTMMMMLLMELVSVRHLLRLLSDFHVRFRFVSTPIQCCVASGWHQIDRDAVMDFARLSLPATSAEIVPDADLGVCWSPALLASMPAMIQCRDGNSAAS